MSAYAWRRILTGIVLVVVGLFVLPVELLLFSPDVRTKRDPNILGYAMSYALIPTALIAPGVLLVTRTLKQYRDELR